LSNCTSKAKFLATPLLASNVQIPEIDSSGNTERFMFGSCLESGKGNQSRSRTSPKDFDEKMKE
jgi:hypothetical protein